MGAFFYGSLPTGGHLQRLGEALDRLAPGERTPPLPYQPRWPQPRRTRVPYAIAPEESPAGRAYLSLIWIVGDALNPQTALDGMVLSAMLMENDAAPLKSALIDSKLGSDTYEDMGVWGETRPDGFGHYRPGATRMSNNKAIRSDSIDLVGICCVLGSQKR